MGNSQDGIPYLDFNLRNSGTHINVEWQILPGNSCQDVQVWRGLDSVNLKQVYIFPGICGDDDSLKTYNYLDSPPTPGVRYYYRLAIITDRTKVKSLTSFPQNDPELFPNPASESLQIVRDPQKTYDNYSLYDLHGRMVLRIPNPEIIERVNLEHLAPGNYFIRFEGKLETRPQRVRIN